MKIMIYGYSGSGKSTLAKVIQEEYHLPILYIDKIIHKEDWKHRDDAESKVIIEHFLKTNNNWIIDGNGTPLFFEERAKMATNIIFMNLDKWSCYKNAKKRYKEYKTKERESRPDGCEEKFDFKFKKWLLFSGRKKSRKQRFENIAKTHAEKTIIIKNNDDLQWFLQNLDKILLK